MFLLETAERVAEAHKQAWAEQAARNEKLWKQFGELQSQFIDEWHWRTEGNISVLYQLDTFDWTVLVLYFTILGVLAIYGAYRIKQVVDFWRYRRLQPAPKSYFAEDNLPLITVQLPLFNEVYVVERLLAAVTAIDYPRERLEIQVLDDSTDDTRETAAREVSRYRAEGFDIV